MQHTAKNTLLFTSGKYLEHKEFWNNTLPETQEGFFLDIAAVKVSEIDSVEQLNLKLSEEESTIILNMVKNNDFGVYLVHLALVGLVLSRYNRTEFISFYTPLFNATKLSEPFVDEVPLILSVDPSISLKSLIQQVQKRASDTFRFQNYPLEYVGIQNDDPLSNIGLSYRSLHPGALTGSSKKLDLNIEITRTENRLALNLSFNPNKITPDQIHAFFDHFKGCIAALQAPDQLLKEICFLSSEEQQKLIKTGAGFSLEYDRTKLIHELFEGQVVQSPEKIAIVSGQNFLSYEEVNRQANQLAHHLRSKGLKPNDIAGIYLDRSPELIISMLGILKSGAAYVPIDTAYPPERIRYMLHDSGIKILVGKPITNQTVEVIHPNDPVIERESSENPEIVNTTEDLAYLIYTSGSTGQPKGVAIEHRQTVAFLNWCNEEFRDTSYDTLFASTSYSFDLSIFETFFPLINGKKIRQLASGLEIKSNLNKAERILINTVPSVMVDLLYSEPDLSNVVAINMAGEPIPVAVKKALPYGHMEIRNLYGPSEDTTYSTCYQMQEFGEKQIIGNPIANTQVFLLDSCNTLCPYGIAGELVLAGEGLAREYFNKPEQTSEKFIPNPFDSNVNSRMYKTGDLARWLPDGTLEYLGRIDNQVKIRGFRIELEEIQNRLLEYPSIREAVVIDKQDQDGIKFLSAYFVSEQNIETQTLRDFLSTTLPAHMIPAYFVPLRHIPLTPNGKTDKKALPDPPKAGLSSEYIAPSTAMEKELVAIWEQLLHHSPIGIHDNFFFIGGNSLKATMMISRIHRILEKELPLRDFFENPTIAETVILLHSIPKTGFNDIVKIPTQEYYALSPAQNRLWLLDQIQEGTSDYNMVESHHFDGFVDHEMLQSCFVELINRHESLRTSFVKVNGEPFQQIRQEVPFHLELVHSKSVDFTNSVEQILNMAYSDNFDLENNLLIRAWLVQSEERTESQIIFVMHHIVTDGWSMNLFKSELLKLYAAFKRGNPNPLSPLEIQYKDYAYWQNQLLIKPDFSRHKDYWIHKLSGELPSMELPVDYKRTNQLQNSGSSYVFMIHQELLHNLNQLADQNNASLFMIVVTAFNVLFSRLTGHPDVLIGTPIAGRNNWKLKNLIGFFLNTIVLRNEVDENQSFLENLNRMREGMVEALEHQNYPFEQLVDQLNIPRDINKFPITSIFLNLINYDEENTRETLKAFTPHHFKHGGKVKFDLNVYMVEYENGLLVKWDYKNELFKPETIEAFMTKLSQLLTSFAEQPEKIVGEIRTELPVAHRKVLPDASWYDPDKTLLETLHLQSLRYTTNPALRYDGTSLTYQELESITNEFAAHISSVLPGNKKIGVCTGHHLHLGIAVLSILKSGNIYVPLDPNYPVERLKFMASDAQIEAIVTDLEHQNTALQLCSLPSEKLFLAEDFICKPESTPFSGFNPASVSESDIAYILYTSGSTGNPKGTVQTQSAILHFISNYSSALQLTSEDVLTGFSSISFDSFVNDFFGALLNGATYCPYSLNSGFSPDDVKKYLDRNGITVWHSVPTVFRNFAPWLIGEDQVMPCRIVKMTGEPTRQSDFELFKQVGEAEAEFVVSYGATESTLTAINQFKKNDTVYKSTLPAGIPVARTEILIQPAHQRVADVLEIGEILIHSPYITPEYWNNEELNSTAFVHIENKKYYQSGDWGKINLHGELEILGRKDAQSKINGMRVDLGEIENALTKHHGIRQASVTAEKNQLRAYLIGDGNISLADLRNFLTQFLPTAFIPAHYTIVNEFPLTPSGKVSKSELKNRTGKSLEISTAYEAPQTSEEIYLSGLFAELLKLKRVGTDDNFFHLGGHSMIATLLISRIHQEKKIKIPLKQLFLTPTVRELALSMTRHGQSTFPEITKATETSFFPLSSAQNRIYILAQFELDSTAYNLPGAIRIQGKINVAKIENTLLKLIARHDALRTRFVLHHGIPFQQVEDTINFELERFECTSDQVESTFKNFVRPFHLSSAPLFRAGMITLSEEEHILLTDLHHIISDGYTLQLISREFAALYQGQELPDLTFQYQDYASWQQKLSREGFFQHQANYWLNRFKGEIPVLELPLDYPRPAIQSHRGADYHFTLNDTIQAKIRDFTAQHGTTTNLYLQTVFFVLLSRYAGQNNLIVGSTVSGRHHPHTEHMPGMFVNSLAIQCNVGRNKTFMDILRHVEESVLDAIDHQDFQFEDLVDQLHLEKNLSRNPLFDVLYNFQNIEKSSESKGMFSPVPYSNTSSKFDLTFNVYDDGQSIRLRLEYCIDLFLPATIEKLCLHFQTLVDQTLRFPDYRIDDLSLLTAEEKHKILAEYNPAPVQSSVSPITERFEAHVNATPDKPAVQFYDTVLSFSTFNNRANQVAHRLLQLGIQSNDVVALMYDRSVEMMVALFGILKSGAAYLPLDPDTPAERIAFILKDSACKVVLTDLPDLTSDLCPVLHSNDPTLKTTSTDNPDVNIDPEDTAYVIYTSGSTGNPKGVMVKHRNVTSFAANLIPSFNLTPKDRLLGITNITFDISVLELICSVITGMTVAVISSEDAYSPKKILEYIKKYELNVVQITPSRLTLILDEMGDSFLKAVDTLLVGGEAMTHSMFERIRESTLINVYNVYGPTETTIWSTAAKISGKDTSLTIGKPLINESIVILSSSGKMVPENVFGEICIGGDGITKGYLNNPDLTHEKFIPHPEKPGELIYKTGDKGRWLPNGTIEFVGRMDFQVKIAGHRIELGEIESALEKLPEITTAIVLDHKDGNENACLVAYLLSSQTIDIQVINEALVRSLPHYMIPSHYLFLEKLPLLPSGKVNRKALRTLDLSASPTTQQEIVSPQNETEANILSIWKEVLLKNEFSTSDRFFNVGGTSVKLVQLVSRISEVFDVNLPLPLLFEMNTIQQIAYLIDNHDSYAGVSEDFYPLNDSEGIPVFCFPPAVGHSLSYKEAASWFEHRLFYGFNFLEHPDPIDAYVRKIVEIQPEGGITLFGYSLGGNLAYLVARALEEKGIEVSDVILLDAGRRTERHKITDEEIARGINAMLEGGFIKSEYLLKKVKTKARNYLEFMNSTIDDGQLNAPIKMLTSDLSDQGLERRKTWAQNTTGKYTQLTGFGEHIEMLTEDVVDKNMTLLKQLID